VKVEKRDSRQFVRYLF